MYCEREGVCTPDDESQTVGYAVRTIQILGWKRSILVRTAYPTWNRSPWSLFSPMGEFVECGDESPHSTFGGLNDDQGRTALSWQPDLRSPQLGKIKLCEPLSGVVGRTGVII